MIISGNNPLHVQQAAEALYAGDLLGLPTETVYGLAADASNEKAVAKIFEAKGRPSNHPLIVHVATTEAVNQFVSEVPDFAKQLMAQFWPGPLTLILPRRSDQAAAAAGGQNSVGVRCPSHPVALEVLNACAANGVWGVAAPSANLFGRVSPTTAAHVASEFGEALLIIDGGACDVGIESTIVDCTRGAPVLLRPGVLTPQQLSEACGVTVRTPTAPDADAPRASGTLESHYAPRARVQLMTAHELQQAIDKVACQSPSTDSIAIWSRSPLQLPEVKAAQFHWQPMPEAAQAAAHALFAQLRAFDDQGADHIWVEVPPPDAAWDGVRDRLIRAATPTR